MSIDAFKTSLTMAKVWWAHA